MLFKPIVSYTKESEGSTAVLKLPTLEKRRLLVHQIINGFTCQPRSKSSSQKDLCYERTLLDWFSKAKKSMHIYNKDHVGLEQVVMFLSSTQAFKRLLNFHASCLFKIYEPQNTIHFF